MAPNRITHRGRRRARPCRQARHWPRPRALRLGTTWFRSLVVRRGHGPSRYPDGMSAAVIWLIVALGLAGAEALTGDTFLLMLGGGALAAAGSSWLLDLPIWTDGAVFLVVSVLLLVLVRPALRRRLTPAKSLTTGIEALEGKSALVL